MKNLYALSFALTLAFLSPAMADFVSKNKVANEVCDEYKKNEDPLLASGKATLSQKMIIEMHQAGCDLTRNIGIIVDNKETDQNKVSLVKSCDRVYRALEDNQERLAQGKKLFSDNDVKSIESNLQWLNSTFDHHCAIVYVPRIATTESGLRIKLTKNKLVD